MFSASILFVADLPKETTYEDISSFFKDHHFSYASLNNKPSSVWAKVGFESATWASKAKHDLNGKLFFPKSSQSKTGKPVRICNYEQNNSNSYKNVKQSLLIKNIDSQMSQREFYEIFSEYGEIESAKIEYDDNGESKGYGYIYYDNEESAEKAKMNLNMKEYYGKELNIVNLIPTKTKNTPYSTLFVMNFPVEFDENDLKKLFDKYGEIKYVSIWRDSNGGSKGCGWVTFEKQEDSSKCIADFKNNKITFPGYRHVIVKYSTNKETRKTKNKNSLQMNYDNLKMQFSLYYATSEIDTEVDLEKEIRLFIKVVMLQEYNPIDIIIDLNSLSGIVTFDNRKSFDLYLQKYKSFCSTRMPSFECFPVVPIKETEKQQNLNTSNIASNLNTSQYPPPNATSNYFMHPQPPNQPIIGNFPSQSIPPLPNAPNMQSFPNMMFIPGAIQPRPPRNIKKVRNKANNGYQPIMPMPVAMPPQNMFLQQMLQMKMFYEMRKNELQFQMNQMGQYIQNGGMEGGDLVLDKKMNAQLMNIQKLHCGLNMGEPVKEMWIPEDLENEELLDEVAECIFEIVKERYPNEAAKITGMIKEKGIQTMNMLLSKKEDLDKMIEQAYEMIKESEK